MSEFNDSAAAAFDEAGEVFGLTPALWGEVEFLGVLDQTRAGNKGLTLFGEKVPRNCTYMVSLNQMEPVATPWADTLTNQILQLGPIKMRIERILVDEMNVTFLLIDASS